MMITKDILATKLQENWMTKNPAMDHLTSASTKDNLDGSLTSLNWLQNLNMNFGGSPPASPPMRLGNGTAVDPKQVLGTEYPNMGDYRFQGIGPVSMDRIDYRTNPYVKPPFSYATLICMAMKDCGQKKVTLAQIYNWITENFMYYRMAEPSWQNSIRHNLSLNKCFEKVARKKDEPGKGGYWRISPNYNPDSPDTTTNSRKRSKQSKDKSSPKKKRMTESDEAALAIQDDLNLDKFLEENCKSGAKVKTEPVTDTHRGPGLLTALTPEHSDASSDNFADILCELEPGKDSPHIDLDLSVTGTKIEPPAWWGESFTTNFHALQDPLVTSMSGGSHPWTTDIHDIEEAIAALSDNENYFPEYQV